VADRIGMSELLESPEISTTCYNRRRSLDYVAVTSAAIEFGREKVPAAAHTLQP
jgi:hypothetical protein